MLSGLSYLTQSPLGDLNSQALSKQLSVLDSNKVKSHKSIKYTHHIDFELHIHHS